MKPDLRTAVVRSLRRRIDSEEDGAIRQLWTAHSLAEDAHTSPLHISHSGWTCHPKQVSQLSSAELSYSHGTPGNGFLAASGSFSITNETPHSGIFIQNISNTLH
jgi:hypothetical protein